MSWLGKITRRENWIMNEEVFVNCQPTYKLRHPKMVATRVLVCSSQTILPQENEALKNAYQQSLNRRKRLNKIAESILQATRVYIQHSKNIIKSKSPFVLPFFQCGFFFFFPPETGSNVELFRELRTAQSTQMLKTFLLFYFFLIASKATVLTPPETCPKYPKHNDTVWAVWLEDYTREKQHRNSQLRLQPRQNPKYNVTQPTSRSNIKCNAAPLASKHGATKYHNQRHPWSLVNGMQLDLFTTASAAFRMSISFAVLEGESALKDPRNARFREFLLD